MESDEFLEVSFETDSNLDSDSDCELLGELEYLEPEPGDDDIDFFGVGEHEIMPCVDNVCYAGLVTYEDEALAARLINDACADDGFSDRIKAASSKCKSMLTRARDVMCTDYGVHYDLDVQFTVGVADLARLTTEMFEVVLGCDDLQVRVGHVGALTATSDDLSNMAVWTGTEFRTVTGSGAFKVHAVSSKIDGYPLIPVVVSFKKKIRNYCWFYCGESYYLKPCSRFFERRAEFKNGVVYTADGIDTVTIDDDVYPVVQSPIVGPTEMSQVLCLNNASDGLILHVGIFEYEVKYAITVDLKFSNMIGYTSDGVGVIRMGLPNGVYEIDLETSVMVRPRLDRSRGNSSALVDKLRKGGTVSQFINAIQVTGVHVCDNMQDHLMYTGEAVTCGIATAVRPKSCTAADVDILQDLPVSFRACYQKHKGSSISFIKRLLSMRGYVIINGSVLWVQEMLPRKGGGYLSKELSDVRKKVVGLTLYPDEVYMDNSYFSYLERPTKPNVTQALGCVVSSVRKARSVK